MRSSSTSESYLFLVLIAVFEWPKMVCLYDPHSKQVNFFLMVVHFDKTIGFDLSRSRFVTSVI